MTWQGGGAGSKKVEKGKKRSEGKRVRLFEKENLWVTYTSGASKAKKIRKKTPNELDRF